MPLEIQKMIVGNQKTPSTIFQQGRLGEFCFVFFFRSVEQLIFVCLGFFACKLFIHGQYTLPAKHQETI